MSATTADLRPGAAAIPEQPVKAVRKMFSTPWASLVVVIIAVLWTVPTFGLLVTSIRPASDVANTGWWTFFIHPHVTFDNYSSVLLGGGYNTAGGLSSFLVNSLVIAIPGALFPLAIATMAAYALAWVKFRGSDFVFFMIFALQVVPIQMALIPLLRLYSTGVHIGSVQVFPPLNFNESDWAFLRLWISHTMFALPLAIFLLHNFMSQLPRDLMEAATMDGANHFVTFRKVVLPLALPAIASFAIFQFLWVWNDLLVALTYGNTSTQPLNARLEQQVGNFGSHLELLTAGAFVSIVVPLIVFLSLQRYFVRGLLAGSVKG
jgi:alpha-glucoside transport system permease protein